MKIKEWFVKNKLYVGLFCFIFFFSLFLSSFFSIDSDYFWHIKAGKYMVNNNVILKYDVFSWICRGKYWMSHEWLFDIYIYLLSLISKYHFIIYCFINTLLLLLLQFFYNYKNYKRNIPFTLLWICICYFFGGVIQPRPHMVSFLLLTLSIYFLYDLWNNENSKKVFFLPLITVFWSNIHGGSSNLSYILCLIFIICGLFSFSFSKIYTSRISKLQLKKYLFVFILCIISVMINPHGIKMLFYPYQNMNDSLMLKTITEWHCSDLNIATCYPYFIISFLIFCIMLFSKNKIKFIDFVLYLFALFLGLKSIRFCIFIYIFSSCFIFDYIPCRREDKGTFLTLITFSLLLLSVFLFRVDNMISGVNKNVISNEMISYIKKKSPKRLFNYYDYGGYLIYKDISVFIDGRCDLYSLHNYYSDYYIIQMGNTDIEKLVEKYKFDYFLVNDKFPIYYYLLDNKNYKLLKSDNNIYFFEKL